MGLFDFAKKLLPITYADLVCGEDGEFDSFGLDTTSDLQNLIQDVGHLLEELPGSNLDDPNRGIGVSLYLSGTSDNLAKLPGIIDSQLVQDSRINASRTTINKDNNGNYKINIRITVSGDVVPVEFLWSDAAGLINGNTAK